MDVSCQLLCHPIANQTCSPYYNELSQTARATHHCYLGIGNM